LFILYWLVIEKVPGHCAQRQFVKKLPPPYKDTHNVNSGKAVRLLQYRGMQFIKGNDR
jgi:hypothetical protein